MFPGEYTQPLARKTTVQVPVISGYVTGRLRTQENFSPTISGTDTTMLLTFENVGNTIFSVSLRETSDSSISGTRIDLISGLSLAVGGHAVKTVVNKRDYLEIYGVHNSGNLRLGIESLRRWDQLGFDDQTDATFYPKELYQGRARPTAVP